MLIKGYSTKEMSRIALGTHMGDVTDEVSAMYREAVRFAVQNGIYTIDGAINYRGMRSEKDVGEAIRELIESGTVRRGDIFVTSKAGLLYGDITERLNPSMYLERILKPQGMTADDFAEFEGIKQTLTPAFYEAALNKSLQNLGLETIDLHYIHIPEISRAIMSEEAFYDSMEKLFAWYEGKVREQKIRNYGIALEFMGEEPEEQKWHFEMEEVKRRADRVNAGDSHLKYVIFEYNICCPYPRTVLSQHVGGEAVTLADACHKLGLKTVASMPLAMGDALKEHTLKELLEFALSGCDHIIVGSKNTDHIKEILSFME